MTEKALADMERLALKVFMERLAQFERDADEDTFKRIFGDTLGAHLWRKFDGLYHSDIVRLWSSLSPEENRTKLLRALNIEKKRIQLIEIDTEQI